MCTLWRLAHRMETIANTFQCIYKSHSNMHGRPSRAGVAEVAAAAMRVSFSVGRSPLSPFCSYSFRTIPTICRQLTQFQFFISNHPMFQFISYHTHSFPLPFAIRLRTANFFSVGRRVPSPRAFHVLAKFTRSPYNNIQQSPQWPDSIGTRSSPPVHFLWP